MNEPLGWCKNILVEKKDANLPEPTLDQLSIARLAFEGKTMGEIRDVFPAIRTATIGKAIRSTRDAIRAGKATQDFAADFPELVAEQLRYKKDAKGKRPSTAIVQIRKVTKSIGGAADSFHNWLVSAKAKYAEVAVPLTVEKMMEGVEDGDKEMVRLSAQVFNLLPAGGKGGGINMGVFVGNQGEDKKDKPRASSRSLFYEDRLRLARQRIQQGQAQAAVEVQDAEEVEEAD